MPLTNNNESKIKNLQRKYLGKIPSLKKLKIVEWKAVNLLACEVLQLLKKCEIEFKIWEGTVFK